MAPGARPASVTPGTLSKRDARWSRAVRRRATVRAITGSPCSSAHCAAVCTKPGVQVLLYSISLPISGSKARGTVSQPMRHPVISQALEKELQLTNRSSGSAISRNVGAAAPS